MKIDKNFFTGKIFKPTQKQLHISDRNECAKGYLEERRYLEESGFEGFVTIEALMHNINIVPACRGVYVVMRNSGVAPEFLKVGTGDFFKGKNPNVSIDILKSNWVDDTSVLYIGKAGGTESSATLRKLLEQYMRFGNGEAIGHWGGRYIWQLADANELVVCWKEILDEEPLNVESSMINKFKEKHGLKRPFANLRD